MLLFMYFNCKCVTVVRSVIISSATCIRKYLVVNNVIVTYTVERSCYSTVVWLLATVHVHVVVCEAGSAVLIHVYIMQL